MDPEECGTWCSALKCPNSKCPGAVVAKKSVVVDPKTDWACVKCGAVIIHRKVVRLACSLYHTIFFLGSHLSELWVSNGSHKGHWC